MIRELMTGDAKARKLAANLRTNVGRLQVALLKKNEHDINVHLGALLEQSEELVQVMADEALLRTQ
jgi:hypothetical protein